MWNEEESTDFFVDHSRRNDNLTWFFIFVFMVSIAILASQG